MNRERFDQLAKGLATNRLSRRQVLKSFAAGLLLAGPLATLWGARPVQASTAQAGTCNTSTLQTCLDNVQNEVKHYINETCSPRGSATGGGMSRTKDGSAVFAASCVTWANTVLIELFKRECSQKAGCPQGTRCTNGFCCPTGTTGCGISSPGSCCGPCDSCVNGTCQNTDPTKLECCGQCITIRDPSTISHCPSGGEVVCALAACVPVCKCPEGRVQCGATADYGGVCCEPGQACKQGVCVDKNCGRDNVACPVDRPHCCDGSCVAWHVYAHCGKCHCKCVGGAVICDPDRQMCCGIGGCVPCTPW